jgi:hypothetical protein
MQAAINQYTFTAATNWNELPLNAPVSPVENFTRSWNQSYPRNQGLYKDYFDATNGAGILPPHPAVDADPYGPMGARRTAKYFENPSYASPDALVGGAPDLKGTNNSRKTPFMKTDMKNEWAILYAPQVTEKVDGANVVTPRFGQNIDRIYNSLTTKLDPNHIVVLFGNNAGNTRTDGGTPINGEATLMNLQTAVTGTGLFGKFNGQTSPGKPDSGDQLFVYTTGHGDSWTNPGGTVIANPVSDKIKVTEKPANGYTDSAGSDSGSGNLDFEIAFPTHVSIAGVTITFDGMGVGPITDEGTSPMIDLSPMIGPANYWDVPVPLSLLNSSANFGSPDDIEIDGLPSGASVAEAVTYDSYGEAWSVGLEPVPEPTTLALLLTASAAVFLMRARFRSRRESVT